MHTVPRVSARTAQEAVALAERLNADSKRKREADELASRDLEGWIAQGCPGEMPPAAARQRAEAARALAESRKREAGRPGRQAQRTAARSRKPIPVARRSAAPSPSIDVEAVYAAMNRAPSREPPAHGMTALQIQPTSRSRTFAELQALAYGDQDGGAGMIPTSPRGAA